MPTKYGYCAYCEKELKCGDKTVRMEIIENTVDSDGLPSKIILNKQEFHKKCFVEYVKLEI